MKIRGLPPGGAIQKETEPAAAGHEALAVFILSGLVFMILLAIVFLPRMFPGSDTVEIVRALRVDTTLAMVRDSTLMRYERTHDREVPRGLFSG